MDSTSASGVNDWLESQIHQQVAIWCEDPESNIEKIAGGVLEKSYLTYRILYKQIGRDLIAVRHRYSQFESLRTDLRDRYHPLGILVPSLPPKNSVAALNAKMSSKADDLPFVKERTLGLTLFCENVVASPWLRNDPQWKAFCRPAGGPITADESGTANAAETQLVGCLKQLELPYKFTMLQRMEDIREEVKNIEGHAKYLLERVRAVQQAERNLQAANEQLKRGLEGWFDAERIHVKSLGGRIFDEHDPVLKQHELTTSSIVALNSVVTVRRNAEEDVPNYTGLTLAALFEYEIANVESLKELLKVHDEMLKEIESLNSKIAKLESARTVKMDQVQDAKRSLEDKQACLNAFYKGFIYFTIPFIARQRASYIRRFFSGQICSTMSNSYTVFKACQEFFKQLLLPAQQVAEETSRMLELLNVRPIAKLPYEDLEGQFLNNDTNAAATSPNAASGGKSPTQLKSANLFLSYESDGLNGLFERALAISQKKPLQKATASTATLTTHLFTTSVASIPISNTSSNNTAATASNSTSNSNTTTAAAEPAPPVAPANPLARRGSAVVRSAEKESLPRFVENDDSSSNSNNYSGGSAFMTPVDEPEPAKTKQPELNEKSKNILSSLLGESSPKERSISPINNSTSNNRASAPKGRNIWDDDA